MATKSKTVRHLGLKAPPRKDGVVNTFRADDEYNVEVIPGQSVRIWGWAQSGYREIGRVVYADALPKVGSLEAAVANMECAEFVGGLSTVDNGELADLLWVANPVYSGNHDTPWSLVIDWLQDHGAPPCLCDAAHPECLRILKELAVRNRGENTFTEFDRTFEVGDFVWMGSFNLTYVGRIASVGPKTVTVEDEYSREQPAKRFTLYQFASHNWDFDLAKVRKENAEWMD